MRKSGILLHISSLPSDYGIGTFGSEARRFCDFLEKSGQSLWQILPLGVTGYGDSPYQSFSSFAGNPYFIDPVLLEEQGYLKKEEYENTDFGDDVSKVDYGKLYSSRYGMLFSAYSRFDKENAEYKKFCEENSWWLDDFALFMALKDEKKGASWQSFDEDIKRREEKALLAAKKRLKEKTDFYKVIQYFFFSQWSSLKKYANDKGIKIIGDIPIYVSPDSADVWTSPENFELDSSLRPVNVAGCPPDAFSVDGQLWGNPLYNWKYMKKDGYSWWRARMKFALGLFDIVRIDHFRGFDAFWSIPYGSKTAASGKWVKGPGNDLFAALKKELGEMPIIAEDLGFMTDSVKKLLKKTGYPGMKVLEFAFDPNGNSDYLLHNIEKNSVSYIGTHDNSPFCAWLANTGENDRAFAEKYMCLTDAEGKNWGAIRTLLSSPSDTVIIQMQDILGLSEEARMNTPSESEGNWTWRVRGECINDWLADIIRKKTSVYRRIPMENGNV